jgi:hypothetical protein
VGPTCSHAEHSLSATALLAGAASGAPGAHMPPKNAAADSASLLAVQSSFTCTVLQPQTQQVRDMSSTEPGAGHADAALPGTHARHTMTTSRIVGERAHAAVSRRPPIFCRPRIVARTEGYTYDANVWALSSVQGPCSLAPCPDPDSCDSQLSRRCTPARHTPGTRPAHACHPTLHVGGGHRS